MIPALNSKTLCPVLAILSILVIAQYYVIVRHKEFITNVKNKLYVEDETRNNHKASIHVLIVAYARTGSSFLGDLLQSYPEVFYYFEPLQIFGLSIVNNSNEHAALRLLNALYECQVSKTLPFLKWQKNHSKAMKLERNLEYWKSCKPRDLCYNSTYMDTSCSNHALVLIKTIHLSLRHALDLLMDYPNLNLKIIYLMRDPRGTFHSRSVESVNIWCKKELDCYDPKVFCARLEDDFKIVSVLTSSNSRNFMLLKFEDITRDPFYYSKELISFLGLNWTEKVETFLRTHTGGVNDTIGMVTNGIEYEYSTYRNSVNIATKWLREMPYTEITKIQNNCRLVLEKMKYPMYNGNETQVKLMKKAGEIAKYPISNENNIPN